MSKDNNDELFERLVQESALAAAKVSFHKGIEFGYGYGFNDGMQAGQSIGYVAALNALKPAISDGLRNGSSVCGTVLRDINNLIPEFITDEEQAEMLEKMFNENNLK